MRPYRRLLLWMGRTPWLTWYSSRVLVPIDRFLYRRTNGRVSLTHVGRRREGAIQSLLLTTTGRRSGRPRPTPVLYLEDGDRLVVVASNFGKEKHPAWSANLLANPDASVQVRDRHMEVRARRATEEEKERLWPRLLELYPAWQDYTERTDRNFRMFFLEERPPR
jgi:deazaflavin-dependent oxidoreductase (nitroreductase family)